MSSEQGNGDKKKKELERIRHIIKGTENYDELGANY